MIKSQKHNFFNQTYAVAPKNDLVIQATPKKYINVFALYTNFQKFELRFFNVFERRHLNVA